MQTVLTESGLYDELLELENLLGAEEISLRRQIAKLLGYELSELVENPQSLDIATGKSYGALLEEIDKMGKEVVREILFRTRVYKHE